MTSEMSSLKYFAECQLYKVQNIIERTLTLLACVAKIAHFGFNLCTRNIEGKHVARPPQNVPENTKFCIDLSQTRDPLIFNYRHLGNIF